MAGEAQLVELEQREVGGLADRDFAELGPADAGRRALGGPAQRVLVADAADAIARPLQQERGADFLHQVGFIVRGRAVDAKPDRNPRLLHLADRAAARRQNLVAAGAMADGGLGLAEPLHFVRIEEDAVRQPGPRIEPAALFEIIQRPAAMHLLAELVLVLGLGQMRMQADVELVSKCGGRAHQRGRH